MRQRISEHAVGADRARYVMLVRSAIERQPPDPDLLWLRDLDRRITVAGRLAIVTPGERERLQRIVGG